MAENLTTKDIEEGKKLALIFSDLSEQNKTMAMVYVSALRDKEIADNTNKANTV